VGPARQRREDEATEEREESCGGCVRESDIKGGEEGRVAGRDWDGGGREPRARSGPRCQGAKGHVAGAEWRVCAGRCGRGGAEDPGGVGAGWSWRFGVYSNCDLDVFVRAKDVQGGRGAERFYYFELLR
jgi:hypothetical protein